MTMDEIRQAVARGYCTPENSNKALDFVLCEAISQSVFKADKTPMLGCATTQQLLQELEARHGSNIPFWATLTREQLEYRTIDQ